MTDENENFQTNKDKTIFEKRGLDMFSSIMTCELQNEMNQLLTEQQNYQHEIEQLKKERNFLFKLLKKQKNSQIQKTKFSFFRQEQISIPPIENTKSISIDSKFTENVESNYTGSNASNDEKYFFSKSIFLEEIRKYSDIFIFERLSDIIELSKNGDSMISYFVNTVGNTINDLDQQNKALWKDFDRLKSKQREATINSIESYLDSDKQDLEILTKIIENCDFDDSIISYDDNDIFMNDSKDFICFDRNINTRSLNNNNENQMKNFDDLNDITDYNVL